MFPQILLIAGEYQAGDPPPVGYDAWHEWAQAQSADGLTQSQCGVCSLWRFPQEMSDKLIRTECQDTLGQSVLMEKPVCNRCVWMSDHRTPADREPNRIAIVEIDGEEKAVELCNWYGSKGWGWCRASGGRGMWTYDGDMKPLSPDAPPVVRVLEWVSIPEPADRLLVE